VITKHFWRIAKHWEELQNIFGGLQNILNAGDERQWQQFFLTTNINQEWQQIEQ